MVTAFLVNLPKSQKKHLLVLRGFRGVMDHPKIHKNHQNLEITMRSPPICSLKVELQGFKDSSNT